MNIEYTGIVLRAMLGFWKVSFANAKRNVTVLRADRRKPRNTLQNPQNLFLFKKGDAMSQQIYIPLGGQHPIPYEFEADTMQVPRGQSSVLSGNYSDGQSDEQPKQ